MALKVDYVVKETGKNLVRNPWLTVATVLCVFVSIVLVGASLLTRTAAGNATDRWRGGVQMIIYMNPEADQAQIDSVRRDLEEHPSVESFEYLDQQAAYEEFKEFFADESPEMVDAITPEALPSNFKVRPTEANNELVSALRATFEQKPGVREVVAADEAIRAIERISNIVSVGMVLVAIALTIAALVLIGNTIQTAIFARRREIEVMKLVGATNWFIRVPFIIEGVIQTLIGAAVAVGMMTFAIRPFIDELSKDKVLPIFQGFVVTDGNLLVTNLLVIGVGVLIGAIGSAVAVSRFLDV